MKKNVVITGASKGIGKDLALLFAEKGHRVFAISRNVSEVKEFSSNSSIQAYPLDIQKINDPSVQQDLIQSLANFGHVDILINNAGLLGKGSFENYSMDLAHEVFNVNFFAPSRITQLLLPLYSKENLVHILNISSMGGFQGSSKFPGLAFYSASKAAIASLTEVLAEEYKETNLRFNALCLGSVDTEMLREAFPGYQAQVSSIEMAQYIADFALHSHRLMNGKVIPVSGLSV